MARCKFGQLIVCVFLVGGATVAVGAEPAAAGFLYGTLTERSGDEHTGFLRWEDEEAFWDDLFHSRQLDVPWVDFVDMKALHKEAEQRYFESHGLFDRLAYALDHKNPDDDISRLFIARYGDIDEINIDADENIVVVLNDGSRHAVGGYSNDVSSDLLVYPASGEPVTVEWDDIAAIRLAPAPAKAVPYAARLYGHVTSIRGEFEGFIQWDKSECTTIDILDSRQQDVVMGDIRSIAHKPGQDTVVTLNSGESLTLSGSNDVGDGHRGVVVETATKGRVTIPWKRFRRVEFRDGGSGRGRETFVRNRELTSTVIDRDGQVLSGRLVYDLDEARHGDIFNGTSNEVEYDIPFAMIQVITPIAAGSCRVRLRDGQVLELSGTQDTGIDNPGVLVFAAQEDQARRVPWRRIREIRLTP